MYVLAENIYLLFLFFTPFNEAHSIQDALRPIFKIILIITGSFILGYNSLMLYLSLTTASINVIIIL